MQYNFIYNGGGSFNICCFSYYSKAVFGIEVNAVATGSMEPDLSVGSLIIVKPTSTVEDAASAQNYYSADRDISNQDAYVNHLPDGWVFVPDNSDETELAGYYYYTKSISPDQSTKNSLFTYIRTTYESLDDVKQYDIIVYAESVQTTDSNGEAYTDYKEAWKDFLK